MPSRRRFLQSVGATSVAGIASVAGCSGYVGGLRPADRHVPLGYQPRENTWPMPRYGPRQTGVSPDATPPRNGVTEVWSQQLYEFSRAVVDQKTVYHTGQTSDEVIARAREDGSEQWRANAPTDDLHLIRGRLYASTEETVVALDAESGERQWQATVPGGGRQPDVLEAAGVVIVTAGDHVVGLHADTGTKLWSMPDGDDGSSPARAALSPRGLVVAWESELAVYDIERARPPFAEPPRRVRTRSYSTRRPSYPAVGKQATWIGGMRGIIEHGMISLIASTSDSYRYGWVSGHDGWVSANPLGDGAALVSEYEPEQETASGRLAHVTLDGETRWERRFDRDIYTVVVGGDVAFVQTVPKSGPERLLALDVASGETRWTSETPEFDVIAPVGDHLVVATEDRLLYLGPA